MKRRIPKTLLAIAACLVMAATVYNPVVFAGEESGAPDGLEIKTLDEMSPESGDQLTDEQTGETGTEAGITDNDAAGSSELAEDDPAVDPIAEIKPDSKHCKVTIVPPEGAPEDFTVTVRKKYDGSGAKVAAKAGTTYLLKTGIYCMWIDQPGFYKVRQPFYVKAGDLKKEKLVASGTERMTGNGPEPQEYFFRWNPQVENKFYGTDDLKDLIDFDTPAFSSDKGPHEFTSGEERMAYLEDAVAGSDLLHMYYLDDYVPIIFCTELDLSGASTAEEAAQIVSADSKLKICYQAQVHGNEPASGEAAMYMVKELAGEFGTYVAANADMYVIPCINAEGSEVFRRGVIIDGDELDLNRDALRLKSQRMRQVHRIFDIVMPEVAVDAHESRAEDVVSSTGVIKHLDDIRVRGVDNPNTVTKVRNWGDQITLKAIKSGQKKGLRTFYYYSTVNSTASRGFYGMYETVSLIIESVGLREGKDHFQRRVFSHNVMMHSIIEYAIANSDGIMKDVSSARKAVIRKGKTYSKTNTFVLKSKQGKVKSLKRPTMTIYGKIKNASAKGYSARWNKARKTRPMPTAYVFSKTAKNANIVVNALQANGVDVYEMSPGTEIKVAQYAGTRSAAKLKANKKTIFDEGAYIVPLAQKTGKVIAVSLEPDVFDNNKENKKETLSYVMTISDLYRYTGNDPINNLEMELAGPVE